MARTKPRKWIADEIARLDPHTDYERIWALSSTYYVNDFLMNWVYAITFPRFLVTLRGADVVLRDGDGKIYSKPDKRMDDTSRHMLVWWENGPEHSATQRSVKSLNNLHRYWAKKYPGRFGFNEDYVYTLCYEAAMMHRLRLSLGMSGFDEKVQIAAWEFWSRMANLFTNVGGDSDEPLQGFPADFAGINTYMDWYESLQWPSNPLGSEVADVVLRPFAERYFPKWLHPLAYQLVTSFYPNFVFTVHGVKRPNPIIRQLMRAGIRAGLTISERIAADPEQSLPELHRARKKTAPTAPTAGAVDGARCPVHHADSGAPAGRNTASVDVFAESEVAIADA